MNSAEERFWSLVSLKLSGEATPEELAEMAELLRTHPEWGLRLQLYTQLWQSRVTARPPAEAAGESPFSRHLQRLSNHLDSPVLQYEKPRRRIRPIFIGAAAAILLGAIALFWLLKSTSASSDGYNTVSTRPGSRSKIQLPDGTIVWLNADSRLTYRVDGHPDREVQLTGEAYFDVAKDKNHPFHVHTPTIDILVLGTTFNVKSYGNEKNTETSLFQGSVEVTLRSSPDKKIVLKPDEKLTVNNNEGLVSSIKTKTASPDDSDQPLMTLGRPHYLQQDSNYIETLWTKNKLAFDNLTLEEVGLQLERWFGSRVTITDDRLKTRRFTGVFEDESLPRVMEALQLSSDFHYTINKKEVIISP